MYRIVIIPQAQKDLNSLQTKLFNQIRNKILTLSQNPRPPGCLKLTSEEGYRVKTGDYRILYRIADTEKIVHTYRIKHRREAYK